jgi:hypothetical protein
MDQEMGMHARNVAGTHPEQSERREREIFGFRRRCFFDMLQNNRTRDIRIRRNTSGTSSPLQAEVRDILQRKHLPCLRQRRFGRELFCVCKVHVALGGLFGEIAFATCT